MRKVIYLSFIASLFLLIACSKEEPAQRKQQAIPVPVVEVPVRTVKGYTTYPVNIEGTINSAVRAKVGGYITDVLVDAGQQVKQGQPLFRLETKSLSEEAEAAKANINAAKVEVEKLKPLVEKGIISEVQLKTAKARLAQAQAGYNSIIANIGYATINSPVSGRIGSINYREGALVSPADPVPLTTISKTEDVYAYFAVNEKEYLDLIQSSEGEDLGEKIKNFPAVELELVNGEVYGKKGTIETISGQVDESTGTITFRAKFPNDANILVSGNSGRIRVPKVYENAVVVPEISTYEQQGTVYVYKVLGDSLAVSNKIEVVDRVQNVIVVGDGVKAGEKIVAKGTGKIRDNTPIQPQAVSFDSVANNLEVVFK